MGVKQGFSKHLKLNSSDFLYVQSFWGHKKKFFNNLSSFFFLGLKNDNLVFNLEYSKEYIKRMLFFSLDSFLNNNSILFVCSSSYVKTTLFFASRSIQYANYNKWINGLLTNFVFKNPHTFILTNSIKDNFILKESIKTLRPFICIEDSNYFLNKSMYPILINDDSKESLCHLYTVLTNNVIKLILYKHYKNNTH